MVDKPLNLYGRASIPDPNLSSIYFPAGSKDDRLRVPASGDWSWNNNWTFEFFLYWDNNFVGWEKLVMFFSQVNEAGTSWFQILKNAPDSANVIQVAYKLTSSASQTVSLGAIPMSTGSFYHSAIVKEGNEFRSYSNGVWTQTATNANNLPSLTLIDLFIGNDDTEGRQLPGWLDEVRISETVRYTGEGIYSIPSARFTNDADTLLLLHGDGADGSTVFTDSSSYNRSLTDDGNVEIDTSIYTEFGTPLPINFYGSSGDLKPINIYDRDV